MKSLSFVAGAALLAGAAAQDPAPGACRWEAAAKPRVVRRDGATILGPVIARSRTSAGATTVAIRLLIICGLQGRCAEA